MAQEFKTCKLQSMEGGTPCTFCFTPLCVGVHTYIDSKGLDAGALIVHSGYTVHLGRQYSPSRKDMDVLGQTERAENKWTEALIKPEVAFDAGWRLACQWVAWVSPQTSQKQLSKIGMEHHGTVEDVIFVYIYIYIFLHGIWTRVHYYFFALQVQSSVLKEAVRRQERLIYLCDFCRAVILLCSSLPAATDQLN